MNTHHIKIAFTEDGKLSLNNLPFKKGDTVEIVISEQSTSQADSNLNSLKGTVIRYDDPFEPVIFE